jgi:hypothetical protein
MVSIRRLTFHGGGGGGRRLRVEGLGFRLPHFKGEMAEEEGFITRVLLAAVADSRCLYASSLSVLRKRVARLGGSSERGELRSLVRGLEFWACGALRFWAR